MMREAAMWNLRLADYRFTYGLLARETGEPLLSPFGFAYPKDGRHPDDVYLLGPDLLVAPIIGSRNERDAPIPEEVWLDFWNSEVIVGPATVTRIVELGSQALFLRSGSIIPLLHSDVQTLNSVNRERTEVSETVTIDQLSHPLTWLIVPPQGEVTTEYINHEGSSLILSHDQAIITPGLDSPYQAFELEIRHDAEMSYHTVTVDGFELAWVEGSEHRSCLSCLWYESDGDLHARLAFHEGQIQQVEWH